MKKLKTKVILLSFIMAIGLLSYPVQASRWATISKGLDPLTGCYVVHERCESGFGFAFCVVGSTRRTETCPPSQ